MPLHLTRVVFAFVVLSVLGFVTNTPAAPVLRPLITVEAEIVTLGDLFDNLTTDQAKPVFRAPNIGTSGSISMSELNAALTTVNMPTYEANGISTIHVTRTGKHFTQADLTTLIHQALLVRNLISPDMQVEITLDSQMPNIVLPTNASDLHLIAFTHGFPIQNFNAKLAHPSLSSSLDISGRLNIFVPSARAATSLPSGTIITPEHIEMAQVTISALQGNTAIAMADIVGKQTTRAIAFGAPLRLADVAAPTLITRSQHITLLYTHGSLMLTAKGQALSNASHGQTISVLNLATRKTLQGVVTAEGTVVVQNANLNLASLNER